MPLNKVAYGWQSFDKTDRIRRKRQAALPHRDVRFVESAEIITEVLLKSINTSCRRMISCLTLILADQHTFIALVENP